MNTNHILYICELLCGTTLFAHPVGISTHSVYVCVRLCASDKNIARVEQHRLKQDGQFIQLDSVSLSQTHKSNVIPVHIDVLSIEQNVTVTVTSTTTATS